MKRDLAGVGGEGRMMARYRGGRDGSETGLVMKKKGEKIDDWYRCQPHSGLKRRATTPLIMFILLAQESFHKKSNMSRHV